MDLFNFKTAYTQARELYGVELIPDEFESLGMIAWEKIGNKMEHLGEITLPIKKLDNYNGIVELPCDVDKIEAVYLDLPDYQATSNVAETPLVYNQYVEKYIDLRRGENTSSIYRSGKLVKIRLAHTIYHTVMMSALKPFMWFNMFQYVLLIIVWCYMK